jgi:hypothetical protein
MPSSTAILIFGRGGRVLMQAALALLLLIQQIGGAYFSLVAVAQEPLLDKALPWARPMYLASLNTFIGLTNPLLVRGLQLTKLTN